MHVLHFHAGLIHRLHFHPDPHLQPADLMRDGRVLHRQRMAIRDHLIGLLAGQQSGGPAEFEDIALGDLTYSVVAVGVIVRELIGKLRTDHRSVDLILYGNGCIPIRRILGYVSVLDTVGFIPFE
jgi:hypothetical protein